MATTNLVVDFLVIGLVGFVWLGPIVVMILGCQPLEKLFGLGLAAIPFILASAYVMGIAINRFADNLTDKFNDRWREGVFGEGAKPSYHNQLNLIMLKSASASDYLSYRRSVIRTARACSINFLLGAVIWPLSSILKPDIFLWKLTALVAVLLLIISALLFQSWSTVLKGYFNGIRDMYGYLQEDSS